jgi:FkbM family methyltransferase
MRKMLPLKKAIFKLTGNGPAQRLLERLVIISQFCMGVGSGSGVESSGEKRVLDIIPLKYQPPYCIFDVGSNQGQYLNLVLRIFSDYDLTVHCFEPSSYAFKILEKQVDARNKHKVRLNNVALGKERGETALYYNTPGSGLASLTKRRLDHFGIDFSSSETVRVNTVDNYCQENNIERIQLLKCDVEGHELDVFVGASNMFHKQAIGIVTFEFGGCNIDTRAFFQDFYYFFKDVQMGIYRITPSGYLNPIRSYKEVYEQFRTTNFVAMRER